MNKPRVTVTRHVLMACDLGGNGATVASLEERDDFVHENGPAIVIIDREGDRAVLTEGEAIELQSAIGAWLEAMRGAV